MRFFAPLRPGDRISATAIISAIETVLAGETITVQLAASNQRQEAVSSARFVALIRGRRDRVLSADSSAPSGRIPRPAALEVVSQAVDRDQAVRYADASGDRNPIHLDDAVAKMVGLPGVIVQGLCTMAFISSAIIHRLCGGEPERLKLLAVNFSRPVFPGDVITTTIWRGNEQDAGVSPMRAEGKRFALETRNQAGVAVIDQGVAEIDNEAPPCGKN
jgi:acyl dehydratase